MIIECDNREDFAYFWLKRVWYFHRFPMEVSKWIPDFSVERDSPIAPIWITLLGLPVHLYNDKALTSIVNLVGTPIRMDMKTRRRMNLSSVRLCVKLDVSRVHKNRVLIGFKCKAGTE